MDGLEQLEELFVTRLFRKKHFGNGGVENHGNYFEEFII